MLLQSNQSNWYHGDISYSNISVPDGAKRITLFPIGAFLSTDNTQLAIVGEWNNAYVRVFGLHSNSKYIVFLREIYITV